MERRKNKNEFTLKEAISNFADLPRVAASIHVVKPLVHAPKKKWGIDKRAKPKYARFRAVVYYTRAKYPSKYPSWDFTKTYTNGKMFIAYSEEEGYNKLIKLCKKMDPNCYNRIDIYVNMSADLRVETRNYNDLVCKIKKGNIVELLMLLRYREDGKLNAKQTMIDTAMAAGDNLILNS